MNLANHTTNTGSILNLNNLGNFVETQRDKSSLLVYGSSDSALNLLNFNCCHCFCLLLSVKYFIHTNTTFTGYGVGVTNLAQCQNGCLYEVVGIGRTFGLSNHIFNASALQYGTHGTSGFQTGTGSSGFEKHIGSAESDFNLMRDCAFQHRNLYEIFLCRLGTLGDCSRYFACFAKTPADDTIAITNNDDSSECEGTTTLGNLCYTVDSNQTVFEFYVTIYFYFIHCHNRLKFKTTFAGCISQSLYAAVIEITVTVEHNSFDTGCLSLLGYKFANFLSLLNLCHLLKSQRGGRGKGLACNIINHLSIYLLVRAENTKTWTLSSSVHVLADTELYLNSSFNFLCCHNRKIN